jgi:hypothetical protein
VYFVQWVFIVTVTRKLSVSLRFFVRRFIQAVHIFDLRYWHGI